MWSFDSYACCCDRVYFIDAKFEGQSSPWGSLVPHCGKSQKNIKSQWGMRILCKKCGYHITKNAGTVKQTHYQNASSFILRQEEEMRSRTVNVLIRNVIHKNTMKNNSCFGEISLVLGANINRALNIFWYFFTTDVFNHISGKLPPINIICFVCEKRENVRTIVRFSVFFQDRTVFNHINGKVSP